MTRDDAYERLKAWARSAGMDANVGDESQWRTAAVGEIWVLTPPGRSNTVYVVNEAEVRAVHPSRESLEDVMAEMGHDPQQPPQQ